jgi:deazaflavin-dependent oxidoreductase (nitroreductase family)
LLYTPHRTGFIVVASKAGAAHHPAWYHNIRAHPDAVAAEVRGERIAVRPRVVEEPERSELWQSVNDNSTGTKPTSSALRVELFRSCYSNRREPLDRLVIDPPSAPASA